MSLESLNSPSIPVFFRCKFSSYDWRPEKEMRGERAARTRLEMSQIGRFMGIILKIQKKGKDDQGLN